MTPPSAAASVAAPRRARSGGTPARTAPGTGRPRRVSGTARPSPRLAPARPANAGTDASTGLIPGLLAALGALYRHRSIDRLLAGRVWIGLVTFALIGIVTLQLGLLKLNAGIGRSLERSAALQTANADLSIQNSELAGGEWVEANAGRLGMTLIPTGQLKFLSSHAHNDVPHAASALKSQLEIPPVGETSESAEGSEATGAQGTESGAQESSEAGTGTPEAQAGETASASAGEAEGGESSSTSGATSTEATEATEAATGSTEGTATGGAQAGSTE